MNLRVGSGLGWIGLGGGDGWGSVFKGWVSIRLVFGWVRLCGGGC